MGQFHICLLRRWVYPLSADWASALRILRDFPCIHSLSTCSLSTYTGPSMVNRASQVSVLQQNSHSRESINNHRRGHHLPSSPQENQEKSQHLGMAGLLAQTGHFWDPDTPMLGLLDPTPLQLLYLGLCDSPVPRQRKPKDSFSSSMHQNESEATCHHGTARSEMFFIWGR